jgi:uncharacterized HAD superfamily protein
MADISASVNTLLRNITSPYNQQPAKLEPFLNSAEALLKDKKSSFEKDSEGKRLKKELEDAIAKGRSKLGDADTTKELAGLSGTVNTHIRNIDSPYNQQPAKLEPILKAAEAFLKEKEKLMEINDEGKRLRKELEAALAKGKTKLAGADTAKELAGLSGTVNTHIRNIDSPYNQTPAKLEPIVKAAEDLLKDKASIFELSDDAKRLKKELEAAIAKGKTKIGGAAVEQELRNLSGTVNTHIRNIDSPYNQQPAKLESVVKAAEEFLKEKTSLMEMNDEGKRLRKELEAAIQKGNSKLNKDAAFPTPAADAPKREYGQPAVANAKPEDNLRLLQNKINSTYYFLKNDVLRLIHDSGCQSVENYIMRSEQLIANNLTLFTSTPEGKKMLDDFQSVISKAIEDLEANRHTDGSAARGELERAMENWAISQKTVPLKNCENSKLEIRVAFGNMSKKTFINANTTTLGFCNPGETLTVTGIRSGTLVVPEGATMIKIERGAISAVL